jgi:hypothetical protein
MEEQAIKYIKLISSYPYVGQVVEWFKMPYFGIIAGAIVLIILFYLNRKSGKIIIASAIVALIFYALLFSYVSPLPAINNFPDFFQKPLKNMDQFIALVSIFSIFSIFYKKFSPIFVLFLIFLAIATIKSPGIMLVDAILGVIIAIVSIRIVEAFYGRSRLRNFD